METFFKSIDARTTVTPVTNGHGKQAQPITLSNSTHEDDFIITEATSAIMIHDGQCIFIACLIVKRHNKF